MGESGIIVGLIVTAVHIVLLAYVVRKLWQYEEAHPTEETVPQQTADQSNL